MAYKITIHDEVKRKEYFVEILKHIAGQIEQGYTSGRGGPVWDIDGEAPVEAKIDENEGVEGQDEEKVESNGNDQPEQELQATEDEES